MSSPAVKTAASSEMERCCALLTAAFNADPVCRWAWPEEEGYRVVFPEFVRAFAGEAFERAAAFHVEGFRGAALWLPPGAGSDEEALTALIEGSVPAHLQASLFSLFEEMDRLHPKEPHWYLPLIGVDPAHQGKGYGSALLEAALERCDREGLPAYLEATSPLNVRLYEQHGFEALAEIRVGSSPPLVPMLRQPRPGSL